VKDPAVYIQDAIESASLAIGYLEGIDIASFSASPLLQDSVVYRAILIGEALSNVDAEFQAAHANIP